MSQTQLIETSNADFSECRTYRYALWRHWDWQGHGNCVMFIGMNPSTADEVKNDTTISKCIGFAKRWGYGGIYMLNLYAFRATYPADLYKAADPVGRLLEGWLDGPFYAGPQPTHWLPLPSPPSAPQPAGEQP